jgi:hypothetical protein
MCQVRIGGGLASLLPLATAPPPEAATGEPPPPPPRTTQTAAIRALLAACSLPCNRTYLLLSPHVAELAFSVLPAAVEQAAEVARRAADAADTATPVTATGGAAGGAGGVAGVAEGAEGGAIDALLLPLLKLLRLLIATQPPAEPARKLQSDLACLLIFSGALRRLTFASLLPPDDTPSLAFKGRDARACTCTCCTCTRCRRAARAAGPLRRGLCHPRRRGAPPAVAAAVRGAAARAAAAAAGRPRLLMRGAAARFPRGDGPVRRARWFGMPPFSVPLASTAPHRPARLS